MVILLSFFYVLCIIIAIISLISIAVSSLIISSGASFYQALMDWKEWIQSITIRVESQECPIWFVAHNGNRYDIPLLFQQEAKLGQPPGTFFESVRS